MVFLWPRLLSKLVRSAGVRQGGSRAVGQPAARSFQTPKRGLGERKPSRGVEDWA